LVHKKNENVVIIYFKSFPNRLYFYFLKIQWMETGALKKTKKNKVVYTTSSEGICQLCMRKRLKF